MAWVNVLPGTATSASATRRAACGNGAACEARALAAPRRAHGGRYRRVVLVVSAENVYGVKQRPVAEHSRGRGLGLGLGVSGGTGGSNGKKPNHHNQRDPAYYANVGSAIEKLRFAYPRMLEEEPELDIFSDKMVFTDRRTFQFHGKEIYAYLLLTLRFHARCVWREAQVSISSMFHEDREGRVYVRWRVTAKPRFSIAWSAMADNTLIYDGMSVYTFDSHGLIREHNIDNSQRTSGSLRQAYERILRLGVIQEQTSPAPIPGSYCSNTSSSCTIDEKESMSSRP
ncbi:hypothetical protein FVE85_2028 [Porphyridium purpureum]|uniref:Uncharacterized protein n=1 Tax=Porphyridium purpureum TaxID=35688 RepID=A0A5J4YZ12_PORPP|nr:hypothetical protein FVE85_2028 [Porphyridium purpureum]|eukprot:POR8733..scf209_3